MQTSYWMKHILTIAMLGMGAGCAAGHGGPPLAPGYGASFEGGIPLGAAGAPVPAPDMSALPGLPPAASAGSIGPGYGAAYPGGIDPAPVPPQHR